MAGMGRGNAQNSVYCTRRPMTPTTNQKTAKTLLSHYFSPRSSGVPQVEDVFSIPPNALASVFGSIDEPPARVQRSESILVEYVENISHLHKMTPTGALGHVLSCSSGSSKPRSIFVQPRMDVKSAINALIAGAYPMIEKCVVNTVCTQVEAVPGRLQVAGQGDCALLAILAVAMPFMNPPPATTPTAAQAVRAWACRQILSHWPSTEDRLARPSDASHLTY